MALRSPRRTSQQLLPLALQLAVIVALFTSLAAEKVAVKYFVGDYMHDITVDVQYEVPFYIFASITGKGGFKTDKNRYIHLTDSSSKPGDAVNLVSTSGASGNTPVYVNDTVYITFIDRRPPRASPGWGWSKHGKSEWFLTRSSSDSNRAAFKVLDAFTAFPPDWPQPRVYYLQSCPAGYCSGLTTYLKDGLTYVKLDKKGSENGDLIVFFRPQSPKKSMSTNP